MPRMFEPKAGVLTRQQRDVHRLYAMGETLVEFLAGLLFTIGSIMFFSAAWTWTGTLLFLVGSILFMVRPTVSLLRELHIARLPVASGIAEEGQ